LATSNRREPRLYSVKPLWVPAMKQSYASAGQGSDAAGPISQWHCSHSRIRIAATSDRHRLPRIERSQLPNPVCPFSFYNIAHAAGHVCTCQVLRPRQVVRTLRWRVRNVLPSALETASAHRGLGLSGRRSQQRHCVVARAAAPGPGAGSEADRLPMLERDDFSSNRHPLVEHDLFRKPVSTFRDHALREVEGNRRPPSPGIRTTSRWAAGACDRSETAARCGTSPRYPRSS
jgi:hypothetical protein